MLRLLISIGLLAILSFHPQGCLCRRLIISELLKLGKPRCTRCGSKDLKKKTFSGKERYKRVWKCKKCGKSITENARSYTCISSDATQKILKVLEHYYFDEGLKKLNSVPWKVPKSSSGRSDFVRRWGKRMFKDPPEVADGLGSFLLVDSTNINRKKFAYFHAVDAQTGRQLHYKIEEFENEEELVKFLVELRDAGYRPTIVVCDLAKTWLNAIKRVFPWITIQACTFHRMLDLNKRLPTNGWLKNRISQRRLRLWRDVKKVIGRILIARNKEEKKYWLNILQDLPWKQDWRTYRAVKGFLRNRKYYHTREELRGCPSTNNLCERQIQYPKRFFKKQRGPKNLEAARIHVRSMWGVYRLLGKHEDESYEIAMVINAVRDYLSIREIADICNCSIERVKKVARKKGMVPIGERIFSKKELSVIDSIIQSNENKCEVERIFEDYELEDCMDAILEYLDYETTCCGDLVNYRVRKKKKPKSDSEIPEWLVSCSN